MSERVLTDLAAHFGFTVERVQGMPRTARSITDQRSRVIYIPQRNDLRTRAARSVVLQTLGHFALSHNRTENFEDYLRQRIESNYFAAAVLAPEGPAVEELREAKDRGDISIEDLKEVFYISYEMAAHRFTNLATKHLDLPVHFLRTDPEGVVEKALRKRRHRVSDGRRRRARRRTGVAPLGRAAGVAVERLVLAALPVHTDRSRRVLVRDVSRDRGVAIARSPSARPARTRSSSAAPTRCAVSTLAPSTTSPTPS